jgi:drug/metabolite transporter (DMT)-like permease
VGTFVYFDFLNPFWWLSAAIILFKAFALIDAASRREDAYRAADKKTKPFWLIILGVALGLDLLFGANFIGSFLTLAGLVAAIVYTVDVRPAIKALTDGRGRGNRRTPTRPW